MYKAVALQSLCAALGVVCAALLFGKSGAFAATLGGLACVVPNALFAWGLRNWAVRYGALQGILFFLGEFAKIFLVLLILLGAAWLHPGINWGAVVIGLLVTLQANFLVFLVKP